MRKLKLNKTTIGLINKALQSGSEIKELLSQLGLSRNWIYAAKKDKYDIIMQLQPLAKTKKAQLEMVEVLKQLKEEL